MTLFTICSNNYLGQAITLGNSIKESNSLFNFVIFLCDKKSETLNYDEIDYEVVEIETFEPLISELAKKYNIIELNTAVKPAVFKYLFNHKNTQKAVYLDPDIFLFSDLKEIESELDNKSVLLTPHILSPIPLDQKHPDENLFLNHGIYNLGFIALRNDEISEKLIDWWQAHTYKNGFIDLKNGIFVDQLPMNMAPLFFKDVKILTSLGYNMGPWNLHERKLNKVNDEYFVNNQDRLHFYHFSSFKLDYNELPIHYYNRYRLVNRPDLMEIHENYNNYLKKNKFDYYKNTKSVYSKIREDEIKMLEEDNWKRTPIIKKMLTVLKRNIPSNIKNLLR